MLIAVVAHIRHPIREPFMGGMEAHVAALVQGLRCAGHEVDLFAAGGSNDARLVPIAPQPYEDVLPWADWRGTARLDAWQERAFAFAFERIAAGGYDVVHNNSLFPPLIGWLAEAGIPAVTSQHVPPFGAMHDAVAPVAPLPHARITVTSASQRPLWGAAAEHLLTAHNGVDCARWTPQDRLPGQALIWSGRITPNKGTALALRAAHIADAEIDLYGPIEDESYFGAEVAPLLDDRRRHRGHAAAAELAAAIANAAGMLLTPTWDEPFGLVAAEALACGTPVIAFDRGAMREVIGPCGIVVPASDPHAMAAAIARLPRIDRAACRDRARARFSIPAMIARYEECYALAMGGAPTGSDQAAAPSASRAAAAASSRSSTSALLA